MFKLGQQVTVKARIIPLKPYKEGFLSTRIWKRIELIKPKRGIVAGIRYVQEGNTVSAWDEGGAVFHPTKHILAVLVATALNATLLALPEDVEDAAGGEEKEERPCFR